MARYDLGFDPRYDYEYRRSDRPVPETGYRRMGSGRMLSGRGWMPGEGGGYHGAEYGGRARGRRGRGRGTMGPGAYGYGTEYGAAPRYGREFDKSRWQIDYGDPFHDRERGTPIRMMRGAFHEYGTEFLGGPEGRGYGATYRSRRHRRY